MVILAGEWDSLTAIQDMVTAIIPHHTGEWVVIMILTTPTGVTVVVSTEAPTGVVTTTGTTMVTITGIMTVAITAQAVPTMANLITGPIIATPAIPVAHQEVIRIPPM